MQIIQLKPSSAWSREAVAEVHNALSEATGEFSQFGLEVSRLFADRPDQLPAWQVVIAPTVALNAITDKEFASAILGEAQRLLAVGEQNTGLGIQLAEPSRAPSLPVILI